MSDNNIKITKVTKIKKVKEIKNDTPVVADIPVVNIPVDAPVVDVETAPIVPEKVIKYYYGSKNLKTGNTYRKKQYYDPEYHKKRYLENKEKYRVNYELRKNRINTAKKILKSQNIDFLKL